MENNSRYLEACGAGERSGLYYTCVNSYLTASELAYILTNSQSRILITSREKLEIAREALKECPRVELCIVADGEGESDRIVGLQQATAGLPHTPIADEWIGTAMLSESAAEYVRTAPWLVIFPGVAISLAVFGTNLFGDALRDILDPRQRG